MAAGKEPNALKGICWLCPAGRPGTPFEDLSMTAKWRKTAVELPWTTPSAFTTYLPHDEDAPTFYLIDVFHDIKSGHGKDLAGSGRHLYI